MSGSFIGVADYGAFVVAILVFLAIPGPGNLALISSTAKGGIAARWAFYDIKAKGISPKAFIFGVTNPVMVQGAVLASIPITGGWSENPSGLIGNGDWVRVDPARRVIELLRRAA